ncbi:MAG: PHP domain-containing protein [Myxococcota bacterium]
MIDLHSHTTASDGQYAPHEQVALAARAGVKVLAVTDHDTVDGLAACAAAAAERGLRLIPGIEFSCLHERREVHLLGHFIDPANAAITAYAKRLVTEREKRMEQMVHKLAAMGIPVRLEQVQAIAGDAPLTRPHLARALVELRICTSTREAFDRFLGDGKAAWAPRFELRVADAISLIHGAGGTATLAHPGSSKVNRLEVETMRKAGLDGLEVIHRDHPPSQRELFATWAKELDLCCTAGSDFHGEKVAPDRLFGSVSMDPAQLAQLEARATRSAAPRAG